MIIIKPYINIRTASIAELIEAIDNAKDQSEINIIAYELTCRTYIPFSSITFEELLLKFGYREAKSKKLTK